MPRGCVRAAARPQTGAPLRPTTPRITLTPRPRDPSPGAALLPCRGTPGGGSHRAARKALPSRCHSPTSADSRRGRAQPQGASSRARVGRQRPESQAAAGPRRAPSDGGSEPERPTGAKAAGAAPYPGPVQGEGGAAAGEAGLGNRSAPPPLGRAEPLTQTNKMAVAALPAAQTGRSNRQDVYC